MVLDRIVGHSDPEVFVDQESNLSSSKETVYFVSFHFLQTNLFLEAVFWMILFTADANLASNN